MFKQKEIIAFLITNIGIFIFYFLYNALMFYSINSGYIVKLYVLYIIFIFLFIILLSSYIKFLSPNNIFKYLNIITYPIIPVTLLIQQISLQNKFNHIVSLGFLENINNFLYENIEFNFDNINCLFSTTTVQIYIFSYTFSHYYNIYLFNKIRFFLILNYFVLSMIFLLHSHSVVLLYFFWELIGFFSFLLITFNNNRSNTIKSSLKAMFFNKISDVFFLILIVCVYLLNKSFSMTNFDMVNLSENPYNVYIYWCKFNLIDILVSTIIVSSFIKSAQIFFHFWLPDSMEAPLPASALIHSATLVASGIYLFIRFYHVLFLNSYFVDICIFINSITFLIGAVSASVQYDLKKILAFSTISNCGLIFLSIFSNHELVSIFFFSLHGFYKSISFIIVGFVINNLKHNQDIRYSLKNSPSGLLHISLLLITSISLSSWFIIYTSIIKHSIISYTYKSIFLKSIIFLGMVASFSYSIRILFILFNNYLGFIKRSLFDINYSYIYSIYIYILIIYTIGFVCHGVELLNNNKFYDKLILLSTTTILTLCILFFSKSSSIFYKKVSVIFLLCITALLII